MELTSLNCPHCGATMSPSQVDPVLATARCGYCRTVFAVTPGGAVAPAGGTARQPVPMPEQFDVADNGSNLAITYRWFSPVYLFLLVFAIGWNIFMVVWHYLAWTSGTMIMSLFGFVHTAVGIGLAYATLAGLVNTTTVTVAADRLVVRHSPFPWRGNRQLEASAISQLYSVETKSRNDNSTSSSYQVRAVCGPRRQSVTLLSGLRSADQALFLEQEIEKRLRIVDVPVAGEVPRG